MARKLVGKFGKHSVKHSVKQPKRTVRFTWIKKKTLVCESPKKPSEGEGQDEPSKTILDSPVPAAIGRKFWPALGKLSPRILVAESQAPRVQREGEGGGNSLSKVFSMVLDHNYSKVSDQYSSKASEQSSSKVLEPISSKVYAEQFGEVSYENPSNVNVSSSKVSDKNSSKVSDKISNKLSDKNSSEVSDKNSSKVCGKKCSKLSDKNSNKKSDKNSNDETHQSLLPLGWQRLGVARKSGGQEGKVDYYIVTERGRRFRSQVQLDKWLQEEGRSLQVSLKPEALRRKQEETKASPRALGYVKDVQKMEIKRKQTKVLMVVCEPDVDTVLSNIEVYCVCRAPDSGGPMVGCDGPCRDWYHFSCLGWGPEYRLAPGAWYCHTCIMVLG